MRKTFSVPKKVNNNKKKTKKSNHNLILLNAFLKHDIDIVWEFQFKNVDKNVKNSSCLKKRDLLQVEK